MNVDKEIRDAEKAEVVQAVKALFIPSSLFLACVMSAAATFLIYHREPLGWVFAVIALTTIASAFFALIRFQNKYRVRGVLLKDDEQQVAAERNAPSAALPAMKIPAPSIESTLASVGSTIAEIPSQAADPTMQKGTAFGAAPDAFHPVDTLPGSAHVG